jgi:hypothetical protein
MKTAVRENPNRWATVPRDRDHGAAGQNSSRSFQSAAMQQKFQPWETFFFLTRFIELIGTLALLELRSVLFSYRGDTNIPTCSKGQRDRLE